MRTVTVLDDYQQVALSSADWSGVQARFTLDVLHEAPEDLVARLSRSEVVVLMRERTPFPASLIEQLPDLRLIVTTGLKNASLDVVSARQQGITVCGTEGSSTSVPEITLGMMIALTRGFVAEDSAVRAGGWQHTIGPGLHGSTLGIIGLGRFGIPVARLAQAFGMDVIAWSPNLTAARAAEHGVRAVSKEELLSTSDIVTLHLPLSDRSRDLLGAAELGLMRPSAYLINTSRGPLVNEQALIAALRSGAIAGAGLDVYDVEPLPADHPLRSMDRTLLLPHLGYVTTDAYRTWFAQVVEDILAWDDGTPVRQLG